MTVIVTIRQPLVSIITPSYRSVRFLPETIKSVKLQTYPHIEHIVVDGGSDDGTLAILKQFSHLRWISEPDHGQSQAINKGFRIASGEIIGWLNSDDTYNPDAVRRAVKFLQENPAVDLVYGDCQVIDENSLPIGLIKAKPFDRIKLLDVNLIPQPTIFMRRSVLAESGGVDEQLHYCMDREFWLRISRQHKLVAFPGYLSANFRFCCGTKSFQENPKFYAEWLVVLQKAFQAPGEFEIPKSLKRAKLQQAVARLHLAQLKDAFARMDHKSLLVCFSLLLSQDWQYILKYPFIKLKTSKG